MKKLFASITVVLISASFIFAQEQTTAPATESDNPNAPVITFEQTVHDYGTLEYGGDGTCYFKFTNTGKEPLIVQQPRSSCGCTVPSWPKTPILPGEGDEIKVTYNTKKVGNINKTVTVTSNAKNSPVILRITGKVEPQQTQQTPEKTTSDGAPVNK
jgi:copper(I)-binding protein